MTTTALIRRRIRPATSEEVAQHEAAQTAAAAPRRVGLGTARATPTATSTAVTASRLVPLRRAVHKNTAVAMAAQDSDTRAQLNDVLQSIAIAEANVDAAVEKLSELHKQAEKLLRESRLTEHSNGAHVVALKETFSSQKTHLDPKRFKASVADADFWACIDVSITKAKSRLGEKEFFRIADVTPGKSNGVAFTIKAAKKPKEK